jgi:hypothetical protein
MNARIQAFSKVIARIAAVLIIAIGLFWTWFGIACEWPHPLGMLMHVLVPGLPLLALGLVCWWRPAAGGAVLVLWGASPLLLLLGRRPFFSYHDQWLSLTPVLVYWLPLLLGLVLLAAGLVGMNSSETD